MQIGNLGQRSIEAYYLSFLTSLLPKAWFYSKLQAWFSDPWEAPNISAGRWRRSTTWEKCRELWVETLKFYRESENGNHLQAPNYTIQIHRKTLYCDFAPWKLSRNLKRGTFQENIFWELTLKSHHEAHCYAKWVPWKRGLQSNITRAPHQGYYAMIGKNRSSSCVEPWTKWVVFT